MKKFILTFALSTILTVATAQTVHVISNSGFNYTPDSLVVNVGDTVRFTVGATHPTLEVDQATWQSNGTSSNNGFDFPSGNGDFVVTSSQTYYYVCTNHVASGMKGRIFASAGMNEEEYQLVEHKFYPNPVQQTLHFEFPFNPETEKLSIVDMSGKAVQKPSLISNSQVDVSHLEKGVYILIIEQGNTAKRLRFVKK